MPSFFAKKPCNLKVILRLQGRFFRLSLRQNFSLTKHSRTPPHLRSHSSRRPAPTPQCRSFVIRPCPKRNSLIVSHLRSNGSNLHQNLKRRYTRQTQPSIGKTLPRKIQSRPAVRLDDTTECALLKKSHLSNFKTTAAETANTPARFCSKCRSNGLPTRSSQFRSLLKQKGRLAQKTQTFARARACATKTGARTRQ